MISSCRGAAKQHYDQKHEWRCFPGDAVVKNPPANAGDIRLIPGLEKPPGGGNGYPL